MTTIWYLQFNSIHLKWVNYTRVQAVTACHANDRYLQFYNIHLSVKIQSANDNGLVNRVQ